MTKPRNREERRRWQRRIAERKLLSYPDDIAAIAAKREAILHSSPRPNESGVPQPHKQQWGNVTAHKGVALADLQDPWLEVVEETEACLNQTEKMALEVLRKYKPNATHDYRATAADILSEQVSKLLGMRIYYTPRQLDTIRIRIIDECRERALKRGLFDNDY